MSPVVGCGGFNLADALLDLDARDTRELRSDLELAPALAGPLLVWRWLRLTELDRWSLATDGYLCELTCTACGKTYVARPTSEVCYTCAG